MAKGCPDPDKSNVGHVTKADLKNKHFCSAPKLNTSLCLALRLIQEHAAFIHP